MPATLTDRIEYVLIMHPHLGQGRCRCGHVTGYGRSLKRHPAEMVAAEIEHGDGTATHPLD